MAKRLFCVGNPDRGDDGVGCYVAEHVTGWVTHPCVGDPLAILSQWAETDDVVIVDAMHSGAEPGRVKRFDALATNLPTGSFPSSHAFGAAEVVELARSLDRFPESLVVCGIEIADVSHGTGLTPAVHVAADRLIEELNRA